MIFSNSVEIKDSALVGGKAQIFDNVSISDLATISENTIIRGNSKIRGSAKIKGKAKISGNTFITGSSIVLGPTTIYDNVNNEGTCNISGKSIIFCLPSTIDNGRLELAPLPQHIKSGSIS